MKRLYLYLAIIWHYLLSWQPHIIYKCKRKNINHVCEVKINENCENKLSLFKVQVLLQFNLDSDRSLLPQIICKFHVH